MPGGDASEVMRLREWRHHHVSDHVALELRLAMIEQRLAATDRRSRRERSNLRMLLDVIVAGCAIVAIVAPHVHW